MKSTPEGKVKVKVKRIIDKFGDRVWSHWPVVNGMGEPTLDCVGSVGGCSFAVETKAPGQDLSPRQHITRRKMRGGGVTVFRIIGLDEYPMLEFEGWLRARANIATPARTLYESEIASVRRPA